MIKLKLRWLSVLYVKRSHDKRIAKTEKEDNRKFLLISIANGKVD